MEISVEHISEDVETVDEPGSEDEDQESAAHPVDENAGATSIIDMFSYPLKTRSEMMQQHVVEEHPGKEAACFLCPSSICGRKYYTAEELCSHVKSCHFKDYIPCPECGYPEPPWRAGRYHTCKGPTTFPVFDASTRMDTFLQFFGADSAEQLQKHLQNLDVQEAANIMMKDPSQSRTGGVGRMKQEIEESLAAAFIMLCPPNQCIAHVVSEPCYAAGVLFKDTVVKNGFLQDLKGYKAQAYEWMEVVQQHNACLSADDSRRIPLEPFEHRGLYCYKVGSSLPVRDQQPRYRQALVQRAQLYLFDEAGSVGWQERRRWLGWTGHVAGGPTVFNSYSKINPGQSSASQNRAASRLDVSER